MAFGITGRNPVDVLDKSSLAAINYNVVKRIDPSVDELLASAGHIVLYDYDITSKSWAHKGVEGTLFLVKRRVAPFFQYIVLNKKSQDHYVEDINSGFKYEMSEREGKTFLLYKNLKNQVVGIWFYDRTECDKVVALLDQISSRPASVAVLGSTTVQETPSALQPPINNPQYSRTMPQSGQATAAASDSGSNGRHADGFANAGATGSLLLQDGQRLDGGAVSSRERTGLDPLQKLFGGVTALNAANAGGSSASSQLPAQATVPLLSASQATQTPRVGGLPPFRNAANSNFSTPTAQGTADHSHLASSVHLATPPQSIQFPASGSSTPFATLQTHTPASASLPSKVASLLKPSFFQAASPSTNATQVVAEEMSISFQAPALPPSADGASQKSQPKAAEAQDTLFKLFGPRADTGKAAKSAQQQASETSSVGTATKQEISKQAKVRQAVKALAASDAFIDLLTAELEKAGALG